MVQLPEIRLATLLEAPAIAGMSRDFIEHGLGWSWTAGRVAHAIRDPGTNVAVATQRDWLAGFGIMEYADDTAHLVLLAIHPTRRHQHLGSRLVGWLEQSARVAGIRRVRLEARADNGSAIRFYEHLGYRESGRVRGYYEGVIDAVRLGKQLSAGDA